MKVKNSKNPIKSREIQEEISQTRKVNINIDTTQKLVKNVLTGHNITDEMTRKLFFLGNHFHKNQSKFQTTDEGKKMKVMCFFFRGKVVQKL